MLFQLEILYINIRIASGCPYIFIQKYAKKLPITVFCTHYLYRKDFFTIMTEHTHTDKTLQGNDKIESAIAALQHEPSQEMLAHVLTVIRRRMNEHGELIIAVDPSSAASGLQVQAIQTDDGRKWWAAFTSFDEELKGSGSVMSTFLTDMKQLFNSAITTDNIQGIIINPWNRTIMLDKVLLRIILGGDFYLIHYGGCHRSE